MNRVVAFLGPLFALAAGGAAAWLGQHFPGVEVQTGTAAATIAAAIEFAAGAGVAGALQYRWLRGWQRWETGGGEAVAGGGIGTGTIVEPVEVVEVVEPDVATAERGDEPVTPSTHADADVPSDRDDVPRPEDEPRSDRPVTLDDPFAPAR